MGTQLFLLSEWTNEQENVVERDARNLKGDFLKKKGRIKHNFIHNLVATSHPDPGVLLGDH